MSTVPAVLERRFEQRWAAKLARPIPAVPFAPPRVSEVKGSMMIISIEPERPDGWKGSNLCFVQR
jgi:hypothetical protein